MWCGDGEQESFAFHLMGDTPFDPDKWETYVEELHPHGAMTYDYDFEKFQDYGETIVGTPEYVAEQLQEQYEAVGGMGRIVGQLHSAICRTGRRGRTSRCTPTRSNPPWTTSAR